MVGLGFGKQGGSKTKGGIPLFFFAPPLAGGCEKKSGVRKERGVHAPRAPPLSTLLHPATVHNICTLKSNHLIVYIVEINLLSSFNLANELFIMYNVY